MEPPPPHASRVLAWTGLATWLMVAAPTTWTASRSPRFPWWCLAAAAFAAAFLLAGRQGQRRGRPGALLAAQGAAVVAMVALLCNGFEGALLVLVAAQLGLGWPLRTGLAWIVVQTLAMAVAIGLHWTPRAALLITPPYLGFQLFAFFTLRLVRQEGEARRALVESHAELLRLNDQLAQRTRLDERLRLAQDLHDVLGHHLTAMSLNLEVAAHQTEGAARDNVRTAQSLARLLLHDVKDLVRAMQDEQEVDLRDELSRLASEIPSPRIHLDLPADLQLGTQQRARAVLRCIQEIVTNAIRHGQARNLWIELRAEAGLVRLAARDDGFGAAEVQDGMGLSGMRRRLEELGGTLVVEPGRPTGFALRATVPTEGPP